jgi:hypothetical protein
VTVLQEPEHVAYGGVVLADVEEIAAAAASGEVVHRLIDRTGAKNGAGGPL